MSRTQDKRTWLIGGAVAAVAVAGAGWFVVVSPVLSDTDNLKAQTASVNQQNEAAQHKIAQLAQKQAQRATRQRELAAALAALPMSSGLPAFTRQLTHQAATAKVELRNIDVGSFSAVASGSGTGSTTTGTGTADGSTSTGTSTTGTAAGAGTTTGTTTTATGGVVSIAVTVVSFGRVDGQLRFLHLLQAEGPRRALVTSVGVTGQSKDSGGTNMCTLTTQLTVFVTPKTSAQRATVAKLLK